VQFYDETIKTCYCSFVDEHTFIRLYRMVFLLLAAVANNSGWRGNHVQ